MKPVISQIQNVFWKAGEAFSFYHIIISENIRKFYDPTATNSTLLNSIYMEEHWQKMCLAAKNIWMCDCCRFCKPDQAQKIFSANPKRAVF